MFIILSCHRCCSDCPQCTECELHKTRMEYEQNTSRDWHDRCRACHYPMCANSSCDGYRHPATSKAILEKHRTRTLWFCRRTVACRSAASIAQEGWLDWVPAGHLKSGSYVLGRIHLCTFWYVSDNHVDIKEDLNVLSGASTATLKNGRRFCLTRRRPPPRKNNANK